ncbi:VanZ family protein [Agromyces albus]|uniref:VanZ family protein n=1 Tax=Agromyces albus TaxID=205332 RepID=UPI002787E596|nr:VanZ family protein [Agromyces albus]MDQ0576583.1 glycopeptide antibiotics resistance protein [Agromyces albus]
MPGRRLLPLLGVTTAYLALVAWATLGPAPWRAEGNQAPLGVLNPSIWLERATWTTGSSFEFTANILMFVPVGVLFAMLFGARRWIIALGAAALLTCAIEVAQIPLDDRISDPRDLLANTTGAVIGLALAGMVWAFRWAWIAGERAMQRSV